MYILILHVYDKSTRLFDMRSEKGLKMKKMKFHSNAGSPGFVVDSAKVRS